MKHPRWILALTFVGALTAAVAAVRVRDKGGTDDFGPYTPVANWLKPVRPGYLERGDSVFVESKDRIIYTTDNEFPEWKDNGEDAPPTPSGLPSSDKHFIMILDANGNVVEEWKQWQKLFVSPHGVQISPYDPERNIWIVDRDGSQIFKFSHDGKKILLTLGERGVIANDDTHFGRPADLVFAPDGSFYVADGYANTRVIKFDKDGKRLFSWGTPGSGPGQFKVEVHDVALDPKGRVFVADRGNDRIQIFDQNGKYLDQWDSITKPSFIWIAKNGYVWVVVGVDNRIAKYDLTGKLLTYWGTYGLTQGKFDDPHRLSVDSSGNLYVAVYSDRKVGLEKFLPRPDADRSRLIGLSFNRSLP
jgi:peptidylamidoglycolate lyase